MNNYFIGIFLSSLPIVSPGVMSFTMSSCSAPGCSLDTELGAENEVAMPVLHNII